MSFNYAKVQQGFIFWRRSTIRNQNDAEMLRQLRSCVAAYETFLHTLTTEGLHFDHAYMRLHLF